MAAPTVERILIPARASHVVIRASEAEPKWLAADQRDLEIVFPGRVGRLRVGEAPTPTALDVYVRDPLRRPSSVIVASQQPIAALEPAHHHEGRS